MRQRSEILFILAYILFATILSCIPSVIYAGGAPPGGGGGGTPPSLPPDFSISTIETEYFESLGLDPQLSSFLSTVLAKDTTLSHAFDGLTGPQLEAAIGEMRPTSSTPTTTLTSASIDGVQQMVESHQDISGGFSEINQNGTSSFQEMTLKKLIDRHHSSQFQSLASSVPQITKFHSFTSPVPQNTLNQNISSSFRSSEESSLPLDIKISKEKVNLWIQSNNQLHNARNRGSFTGMHSFTRGGATGMSYKLTEKISVGILGGGSYTTYNLRLNKGNGTSKNFYTGVYGTVKLPSNFYVNGSFIGGKSYYNNNRNMSFPGINMTATEAHRGYDLSGRITTGFKASINNFKIQPFIGLSYLRSVEDGYTETNASVLSLTVQGRTNKYIQGETGIKVSHTFKVNDVAFSPNATVGLVREQPFHSKNTIAGSFTGLGNDFVVDGNNAKKNQFMASVGLSTVFPSGAYIDVSYNAKLSQNEQTHEGVIRVGMRF